jgi:hypothetical protein
VCAALPLYWRIVGRTTRRQLVFGVYQFFVACLAAANVAMHWSSDSLPAHFDSHRIVFRGTLYR